MKKKVLIIQAHPDENSFNNALALAYEQGAKASGHDTALLHLGKMEFSPVLKFAYKQRTPWEPDLEAAWEKILWSDHIVWVYPTWWGTMPALMKGFIDRLFLPGKAFQYRKDSIFWDKLLKGRSARLITTMDSPIWYNSLMYGSAGHKAMKKATLEFCGVKPVKITTIGKLRWQTEKQRTAFLEKVKRLGLKAV